METQIPPRRTDVGTRVQEDVSGHCISIHRHRAFENGHGRYLVVLDVVARVLAHGDWTSTVHSSQRTREANVAASAPDWQSVSGPTY